MKTRTRIDTKPKSQITRNPMLRYMLRAEVYAHAVHASQNSKGKVYSAQCIVWRRKGQEAGSQKSKVRGKVCVYDSIFKTARPSKPLLLTPSPSKD